MKVYSDLGSDKIFEVFPPEKPKSQNESIFEKKSSGSLIKGSLYMWLDPFEGL